MGRRLLIRKDWRYQMPSLGQELSRLRKLNGWTLRDVEERSGKRVSNSYLYQLENDKIKEPSPHILFEIAQVYNAEYPALMELAGFVVPSARQSAGTTSIAFDSLNLTEEEKEEVMDFIEFRRRKRKPNEDTA
jgi:HTH-type transcriptional regulator, competence development regulator